MSSASILAERIDELSGERVPDTVREKFDLLKAHIDQLNAKRNFIEAWEAGYREVAAVLQCSKNSVGKELGRMESNGLIVVIRPPNPTRHQKQTISIASDADEVLKGGAAMMTPEALKEALALVEAAKAKLTKYDPADLTV